MIKSLVRRISIPRAPAIADGRRVYAVGDIHGRLDLLDQLLERIELDDRGRPPAERTLVFLGDLIDRGPDSCGVVERLRQLQFGPYDVRLIAGNHEQVFLRALSGDHRALKFLARNGGRATLLSYGITEQEYEELDYPELTERLIEIVPPEHVAFISSFDTLVEIDDYLFVHAGLRPGVPIEQQCPEDLRWIRTEFLDSRSKFEKFVVHGHSVSEDVDVRANRIGIDTGAYASGRLSALALEGTDRWFLST